MDTRTLLFTDIVDSTNVVQRLGDAAAAALWSEHDRLARELLAEHGGLEIDRSDGFFLSDLIDRESGGDSPPWLPGRNCVDCRRWHRHHYVATLPNALPRRRLGLLDQRGRPSSGRAEG